MLVLTRKVNEAIVIDGVISLKVLKIQGGRICLGIEAPDDVSIYRKELLCEKVSRSTVNTRKTRTASRSLILRHAFSDV